MVVKFVYIVCALILVAMPGRLAWADAAQDQLVEQGVAFYDDEEYEKAKEILLPLAETGHPKAMNMVGLIYAFGDVFPTDEKTECNWYEKSANSGFPPAMYNLSICYDGNGRTADPIMSKELLIKAAGLGHIRSMINLASLDKSEGEDYRYWMNKAREHGSVYAKVSLYLQGYAHDVPDLYIQDKVCVYVRILMLGGEKDICD